MENYSMALAMSPHAKLMQNSAFMQFLNAVRPMPQAAIQLASQIKAWSSFVPNFNRYDSGVTRMIRLKETTIEPDFQAMVAPPPRKTTRIVRTFKTTFYFEPDDGRGH